MLAWKFALDDVMDTTRDNKLLPQTCHHCGAHERELDVEGRGPIGGRKLRGWTRTAHAHGH